MIFAGFCAFVFSVAEGGDGFGQRLWWWLRADGFF